MKYLIILSFLLLGLGSQAQAGAEGFVGISCILGTSLDGCGLTVKLLSDDDENTAVAAIGASYYPYAKVKKFGVDVGIGYLLENFAVTGGWDFIQMKPQVAAGYIDTEDSNSTPAAPSIPSGGGGSGGGGSGGGGPE